MIKNFPKKYISPFQRQHSGTSCHGYRKRCWSNGTRRTSACKIYRIRWKGKVIFHIIVYDNGASQLFTFKIIIFRKLFIEFQRSSDRSWKQLWGILRGPILFFYKDRQNQVFWNVAYIFIPINFIKMMYCYTFLHVYNFRTSLESFVGLRRWKCSSKRGRKMFPCRYRRGLHET